MSNNDYASTATTPFASVELSDMSSLANAYRATPAGGEPQHPIAALKQQKKRQQPLVPFPTPLTTALASSRESSARATAGPKQHDFNTTAETQTAVRELSRMLGRPEDETFEWLTSDLVILPFDDWVRDAVLVPGAAVTEPNLERVERELVLFFQSTVRADADIPAPSLAELAAARGNVTGGTAGCTVDDLVKRFALALVRGNLGRGAVWEGRDRGGDDGARRSYGYAELVPVALRVFRHLTGLEL